MKLVANDIVRAIPTATPHAHNLSAAAERFHIDTHLRQCHWLGQMCVESAKFTKFRESLDYRWDRLVPLFGTKRISHEQARRYGRIDGKQKANQEALARILYGGSWGKRKLGNLTDDDAWHFIGHGPKQITGRDNHLAVSLGIFGDDRLLEKPELLEESWAGCMSAGYYWDVMRNINPIADADDIFHVTKLVNGGTNGLEGPDGRRYWTDRCKAILSKLRVDFSDVTAHVTSTEHIVKGGE